MKAVVPRRQDAGARAIDEGLRRFYQTRGGPDRRAGGRRRTVARRAGRLSAERVSRDEGDLGQLSGQHGPRHVDTAASAATTAQHAAKDGSTISADCEYCHTQIETPIPAPKSPK